jgi:hypothetical protein
VGVGRGPGPLRSAGIGSPGCGHPDKAGPAARVSSARPNVACPACIARSASRSGPAADWHAGKVAASGRSIRPTRLTQGGPRYSQKHRACAFAGIGHAAAALKRPMISRRRIAVPKLDRASVTVRTWGLKGGRGLFEMEFSFGSAFSALGQNAKYSERVDGFRCSPNNGHHPSVRSFPHASGDR